MEKSYFTEMNFAMQIFFFGGGKCKALYLFQQSQIQ